MRIIIILGILIATSFTVSGQEGILGTWKTVDDKTGEAKSYVDIYEKNGKVYGKISRLLRAEASTLCDACKGDKKDKPILGMMVIEDMEKERGQLSGGRILDPESGNTYKCKIWLSEEDSDILRVRGIHWTGLYRTQEWRRVQD